MRRSRRRSESTTARQSIGKRPATITKSAAAIAAKALMTGKEIEIRLSGAVWTKFCASSTRCGQENQRRATGDRANLCFEWIGRHSHRGLAGTRNRRDGQWASQTPEKAVRPVSGSL